MVNKKTKGTLKELSSLINIISESEGYQDKK